MNTLLPILLLLVGLALGGGAVWLVMRGKTQHAYDRGKVAAQSDQVALTERLAARQATIDELTAKVRQLDLELRDCRTLEAGLKAKEVQLATTLLDERKQTEEKLAEIDRAEQKLANAFKALASDALKSNNQSFLDLAKSALEKFQETATRRPGKTPAGHRRAGQAGEGIAGQGRLQDQRVGKSPGRRL